MNNALEDIVDAYLRRIEKCKLVERNVFMTEGEIDAIGIDPVNKRIIVCEATASLNAYGPEYLKKLKGKFARAEGYVKSQLSWLGFEKVEGQLWAPHATKEQRKVIAQCPELKTVKVIDASEYFQRMAKLRKTLVGADQKSLNPTCQLLALEETLKVKQKNRQIHAVNTKKAAIQKMVKPVPSPGGPVKNGITSKVSSPERVSA